MLSFFEKKKLKRRWEKMLQGELKIDARLEKEIFKKGREFIHESDLELYLLTDNLRKGFGYESYKTQIRKGVKK